MVSADTRSSEKTGAPVGDFADKIPYTEVNKIHLFVIVNILLLNIIFLI